MWDPLHVDPSGCRSAGLGPLCHHPDPSEAAWPPTLASPANYPRNPQVVVVVVAVAGRVVVQGAGWGRMR
jgi:hypothetical protein